jgi:hypothetical protein
MKSLIDDKKIHISIFFFLLLIFAGCNTSSPTTIVPVENDHEPSATVEPSPEPSSTPTQPPPTETPPPPTPTITSTSTSTSTPTPTSEPPTIVVNEDTVCRTGPGLIYDIRTYISEGTTPILLGHVKEMDWWSVEEPEFNALCWVSSSVVTVNGVVNSLPEFTPEPTPTIESSPTPVQKGVIYYLVAKDTGGALGCGDTLIPVYTGVPTSGDLEKDIHNSLHALLKLKVKDFGGYYNPLHNAHLNTGDVSFNEGSGNATVNLNGSIPKPEDECEYHRVRGVLWETVRHYRQVKGVTFWIGDKLIGDLIAVIDR